jgi:hypothetical protein
MTPIAGSSMACWALARDGTRADRRMAGPRVALMEFGRQAGVPGPVSRGGVEPGLDGGQRGRGVRAEVVEAEGAALFHGADGRAR